MSENEKQKSERDLQRDAFEGLKGRKPQSDRELDDWLATDEGKIATMFEPVSGSRWGEVGRS
jgi:hypothetical protein